jgi:hypothetical protein
MSPPVGKAAGYGGQGDGRTIARDANRPALRSRPSFQTPTLQRSSRWLPAAMTSPVSTISVRRHSGQRLKLISGTGIASPQRAGHGFQQGIGIDWAAPHNSQDTVPLPRRLSKNVHKHVTLFNCELDTDLDTYSIRYCNCYVIIEM